MSKKLVTEELVFAAADELLAEGVEPTIKLVHEKIGVGSYSTIKPYLDAWKRGKEEAAVPAVPKDVEDLAARFVKQAWAQASRLADEEVQAVKAQAAAAQERANQEAAEALDEIERLERRIAEQDAELERRELARQAVEIELAAVRQEAGRVGVLERQLEEARRQLSAKAEEAAHHRGESEALKTQLDALMARFGEGGEVPAAVGRAPLSN